jgi:DEAD/DEAH box helicase domain-containing protein
MLPSLLAREINEGLKNFIITGFETPTPFFQGIFTRFVEEGGNLCKGPYLSLGLPFITGTSGKNFFPGLAPDFPPYIHQEQAWQRLTSSGGALPALIATGTGSGKTECFLYPILDHCHRHPGKGIKAIIIYPLNPLATDQAKRFAETIHRSSILGGKIRVGLFVGEGDQSPRKSMGKDFVITDKEVLRENPPDVLLTNYKMLDYLLIRPKDQPLWRFNGSETLRYLVVDELHTFDGAQGTDLACLIRRLKARLKTPAGHLVAVGTSATLGSGEEQKELLRYASQIFQLEIDGGAIISESRQSKAQFLGDGLIEYQFFPPADLPRQVSPEGYPTMAEYLAAQYGLFFPGEPPAELDKGEWRSLLGRQLKKHILFSNLLQLLARQPRLLAEAAAEIGKTLPAGQGRELSKELLNSLCALIALARNPDAPSKPLVQLRLQFWVRELRRMVTRVTADSSQVSLLFADDLKNHQEGFHLPLVQCSKCHATAWIGFRGGRQGPVKNDLRGIYNAFFKNSPDAVMLVPLEQTEPLPPVEGLELLLCPGCGNVQGKGALCQACGEENLARVFQPANLHARTRAGEEQTISERHCPACEAQNSMMVFGSRAASLASVAIHHGFATPFNDDKKLIAFSDSVQDAAHRAGFFTARTWQNNIRMAMAQALRDRGEVPLTSFYELFPAFWRDPSQNPRAFDEVEFVCQFIAPNMLWYPDYQELTSHGKLPRGNRLAEDIGKRLEWEVLAEFGYRAGVGRSLERTGCAAMGIHLEPVELAVAALLEPLREGLGLRDLTRSELRQFLLGVLLRLKERGGISHRFLQVYIESGGKNFLLSRQSYLPTFAPETAAPIFLTDSRRRSGFDGLFPAVGRSWHQRWFQKTLGRNRLLPQKLEETLYPQVLAGLVKHGLLLEYSIQIGRVWGLNPEVLYLSDQVTRLATDHQRSLLVTPAAMAPALEGMPSLDSGDLGSYRPATPQAHWLLRLYRQGEIRRVIAQEHTGLLDRDSREQIERNFIQGDQPWYPNLLSATPTLEMGIDIGDLSSVLLCSVPPGQANYLQRIGRAGRRDGNAFSLTLATGTPHDLFFYAEPEQMMAGRIEPPGVFLNAAAVIERQLTAFCFDCWVATGVDESAIPKNLRAVLDNVDQDKLKQFPFNFLTFTREHTPELWENFLALFADEFSERTREHLREFIHGSGKDGEGLEMRLVRRLHELCKERHSIKSRIKSLKRFIDSQEAKPQDEATVAELEQARQERSGMQDVLRAINRRDTLNFLTDEGLIPNYAFPEAGVLLRSVIYRRRENPKEGEAAFQNEVFEYERPGAAAISELAPNNRFYAGGRQVRIDQIDLSLSEIEIWRFCPSCSHAEKLVTFDTHDACPRCGDAMWADIGQKGQMVRLRQVMANTSDRESRIGDDVEDREPTFYTRQMLAGFNLKDIESAWRVAGDILPFGFEYIRRTTFREMNFGEYSAAGDASRVAGVEGLRPGFRICRFCGKVQGRKSKEQDHAFTCKAKVKEEPGNLIDCLYLYREFTSEAVRILLPVTVFAGSERYLNSFIAAMQLGLRKKFGGRVDHLRMMAYDEPIANSDARRQYLMLYDSVPGGTGYLHELLRSQHTLLDVFRLARDTMTACSCNHDTAKDGCYSCLYAYRNSYGMESTSRNAAVALLSDILEMEDRFEPVASVGEIKVNPVLESELETRFIEALRKMALQGLDVQVQPQVVQGKPGYFLRVGANIYTMEPQVNLGAKEGVHFSCCPDFLIRSARESLAMKPVAIFLDGFKYHRDIVSEDAAKRLSLVQSARYWQWSLTWQDVIGPSAKTQSSRNPFTEDLRPEMQQIQSALEGKFSLGSLAKTVVRSPLEQLLQFLLVPMPEKWQSLGFVRCLGWLDQGRMREEDERRAFDDNFRQFACTYLQQEFENTGTEVGVGGLNWNGADGLLRVMCAVPYTAITEQRPAAALLNVILDTEKSAQEDDFKAAWQGFLRAYNLLQFLPKAGFTGSSGAAMTLYEGIPWSFAMAATGEKKGEAGLGAWDVLLAEVLEEYHQGVQSLAQSGIPLPVAGYELQDGTTGEITAEAELAWPTLQVAAISADQQQSKSCFEEAEWQVVVLDEEGSWVEVIVNVIRGLQHGG